MPPVCRTGPLRHCGADPAGALSRRPFELPEVLMSLATSTVAMMLPVTDPDRAKTFYTEKLGLHYTGTNEEGSATYALAVEMLPPESPSTILAMNSIVRLCATASSTKLRTVPSRLKIRIGRRP